MIELERTYQASRAVERGLESAKARIVLLGDKGNQVPVALIRRFDRDSDGGRIPYQSAASLLQASREQDRSYAEIAGVIRSHGHAPTADVRRHWRECAGHVAKRNICAGRLSRSRCLQPRASPGVCAAASTPPLFDR